MIDGQKTKIHYLAINLPQSGCCFVKAYLRENTESFCDGHVSAFKFFGGVPNSILYDNTTIAVAGILGDGTRKRATGFSQLQSHYLFIDKFAGVGKGNEKGSIENFVGYARRNFMVPIPRIKDIDELNDHLLQCCTKRQQMKIDKHKETVAERFVRDKNALLKLPVHEFRACRTRSGKVNSESLVRFETNDYSVPIKYGYYNVLVKAYIDKVIISFNSQEIASHTRLYGKGEVSYNPLHYLELISRKVGSFAQAAPLKGLKLPSCFDRLLICLKAKYGNNRAIREYIKVLQLLEEFELDDITKAVTTALTRDVLDASGIKHIILLQKDKVPEPLGIKGLLSKIQVLTTNLTAYNSLLH